MKSNPKTDKPYRTQAKKIMVRQEWCKQLGLGRNDKENDGKDLKICAHHELEVITKRYTIRYPNGEIQTFSHEFPAPNQTACNNFRIALPATLSKGTGRDHFTSRILDGMIKECGPCIALGCKRTKR